MSTDSMLRIEQAASQCQACHLAKHRYKPVVHRGSLTPTVLFIGEAPGEQENLAGRPFVGRAGILLDKWILHLRLMSDDYAVINVVKCRSFGPPSPEACQACRHLFDRQLKLLKPKYLVALGKTAFEALTAESYSLQLTGNFFDENIYVLPHPAWCLRNGRDFCEKLNNLKVALND